MHWAARRTISILSGLDRRESPGSVKLSEVVNFEVRQMDSHGQITGVGSNVQKTSRPWARTSPGLFSRSPSAVNPFYRRFLIRSNRTFAFGRTQCFQFVFLAPSYSTLPVSFLYLYCTLISHRPPEFLRRNMQNSCQPLLEGFRPTKQDTLNGRGLVKTDLPATGVYSVQAPFLRSMMLHWTSCTSSCYRHERLATQSRSRTGKRR